MKIAAVFHMYPVGHGAGAEWMAHEILKRFAERGADVQVVLRDDSGNDEFEGIPVMNRAPRQAMAREIHAADVVFTHLDLTRLAVAYARQSKTPTVHLIHNHLQVRFHNLNERTASLLVFNSNYLQQMNPKWRGPQMVVPPHVPVDRYETETDRTFVTLLNLNKAKGAEVFYSLAERFPEQQFLGVVGAYGEQIIRDLPNVTIIKNTPNVREDVYAHTRVLLVPSTYESWGRVAVEASCSGIPVIASPTPGLKEALGDEYLFADPKHPEAWAKALRALDDPGTYDQYSRIASRRARVLEGITMTRTDDLYDAVQDLL